MFVNMLVSVVPVPDAGAEILLVKFPTGTDGDAITVLRPITVKNREAVESWLDGLSEALGSALGDVASSWGEGREGRRKLVTPLATKLAAENVKA